MAIKRRTGANTLFTLLLLLSFALSAFFVLALSVRAYRASQAEITDNEKARTGLAYLTNKVRSYDEADAIAVGEFDGVSALFLYETHENERYTTVLYAAEDGLYELFAADVTGFARGSGTLIAADAAASFSLFGQTLTVEYEAGGVKQILNLALRSGGGTL